MKKLCLISRFVIALTTIYFNFSFLQFAHSQWTTETNVGGLNGPGRSSGVGIGSNVLKKGYIGLGEAMYLGVGYNDFWEYDPSDNSWTSKASFPSDSRDELVGFAIENKIYLGTGEDLVIGGGLKDFWEFDPNSDPNGQGGFWGTWTLMDPYPGLGSIEMIGFAIGNKGYVGTGITNSGTFVGDFWEFDPSVPPGNGKQWTPKDNFPGPPRGDAFGFSINNIGYIGGGREYSNQGFTIFLDFWAFDPSAPKGQQWSSRDPGYPIGEQSSSLASFPDQSGGMDEGEGVGFSVGNYGYAGSGGAQVDGKPFYQYDPNTNEWTLDSYFPGRGYEEQVGFSICNTGYIGTGSDGYKDLNEFYAITFSVPIEVTVSPSYIFDGAPPYFFTAYVEPVEPTGIYTYQWYNNSGSLILGATLSTYTPSESGHYYCLVNNGCSDCYPSTANTCGTKSNVVKSVSYTYNIYHGIIVRVCTCIHFYRLFTAHAPEGLTPPFYYLWYKGDSTLISYGFNDSTYAINSVSLADSGRYTCIVTDTLGNGLSQKFILTVDSSPQITNTLANTALCVLETANFAVNATGGDLSYQWTKGENNITNATNSTFSIPNLTLPDTGRYKCIVGNSCGNTTSNEATLTINTPPHLRASGGDPTVCEGNSISFTTEDGRGTNPLYYQWYKDDTFIPGATNTVYTINSVTPADTGTYMYMVNNMCGSDISYPSYLSMNTPSTAPSNINGTNTLCNAGSTTLTATGGTAGTSCSYQWGTGSTVGSNVISGATLVSITVTPTSTTTYWVRRLDPSPCSTTTGGVTQTITVDANLTVGITGAGTACNSINLTANANNATSYLWSGGSSTTTAANTFTSSNTYTVTVTDNNGCTGTASKAVTINSYSGTFTDNSDGYTMTFTIPTCITSITVKAYGGQGGGGGKGAYIVANGIPVTAGAVLDVRAGLAGLGDGGGGGAFVWNTSGPTLYVAAGGGGGNGGTAGQITNAPSGGGGAGGTIGSYGGGGGGGGGWSGGGSGGSSSSYYGGGGGGFSAENGGTGGTSGGNGGTGGYGGGGGAGGGSKPGGGGGGGYNGAGGGNGTNNGNGSGGGGGGSYVISTATSTNGSSGYQSGNGAVIITY